MNIHPFLSPNFERRIPGDPIDLIVVHSSVGTFDSSLNWLRNPASKVSSHYLVRDDGYIVRLVPEELMAYHAGVSFWQGRSYLNRYSIGIEIANRNGMKGFNGFDQYESEQLGGVAELIADICQRRRISPNRITIPSHQDIAPGRKFDPVGLDMDLLRGMVAPQFGGDYRKDVYFVVPQAARVRQGPGTDFAVAGVLTRGDRVIIDGFTKGERVSGSDQWAHMSVENQPWRDLGFIHSRLLRH